MLYTGNGDYLFKILTHRDLTEATDFGFYYEKPDGTPGLVNVADGAELHENGKVILWEMANDNFLDQAGRWKFQAFAIFDGVTALGDQVGIKVHDSLTD